MASSRPLQWWRGLPGVVLLAVGYLAVVGLAPSGARGTVSLVGVMAAQFGAGLVMLRLAAARDGAAGRPWRLAAASAFASSSMAVAWLVYDVRGWVVPVPSPADVPFFLAVGLQVAAALAFAGGRRSASRMVLFLDGAIVAVALLLVAWQVLVRPHLGAEGASWGDVVLLGAYPLADVVAVTVILVVASRLHGTDRGHVLLFGVGMLALAFGDSAYAYLTLCGTWQDGHWSTVFWVVGYPLMAVAGTRRRVLDVRPESVAQSRVTVLLLIAPVGLAFAVSAALTRRVEELVAVGVLVALVLARQNWSLFHELRVRSALEEEVRVQTESLRVQAYRDSVTGLGNRALLRERNEALGTSLTTSALLLVDLDGFKEVNDSLGHASGDALLRQVGDRLGQCVRSGDTVVRLGGDEFALLLGEIGSQGAPLTAQRVLEQLREPFDIDGTSVQVRGSVGVALGASARGLDEMLRNADLAMYEAKGAGRDQAVLFDPAMHQRAAHRLQVTNDLRRAVEGEQFTVYYQPIMDAASGAVTSVEALVRWDHPERGVVPPSEFLPAAESSGLIVDLGRFVLRAACEQVVRWRQDWPDLSVAVNVSQRELMAPDYATRVATVLRQTGLPAAALHLEITETVLAGEEHILSALESLAALGVQFSIDDFGTGQSSLSRLRNLPVHTLKIDKSFIDEISAGSAPLLASIIALAHSLGRTVVAEGVETAEQASFLTAHGCDQLQGYLISRPVPAPNLVPVLFSSRPPSTPAGLPYPGNFADLMGMIMDVRRPPLQQFLPALLRELGTVSGLDSTFLTLAGDEPSRHLAVYAEHSRPGGLRVEEGLTVDWCDSLCRRMVEDDLLYTDDVETRYDEVHFVTDFDVKTYVSIPLHSPCGALLGTLCAASSQRKPVDHTAVELMQLFAHALAERLHADATTRPTQIPAISA